MTEKQKIISSHLRGDSNRTIANDLHISKDTVNKYVREYDEAHLKLVAENPATDPDEVISAFVEKPEYDSSNRKRRKVNDEIINLVNECLQENEAKRARGRKKQVMKKTDIWEYVCNHGYDISYRTIVNLVDERENQAKEAYIRQTYDPGISCEFDWGEVELIIGRGRPKLYQMAVFTPPYSDTRFAKLYEKQDTSAFLESHADYFSYVGGVFHQMVYDNMRVAVKKFVGISEKEPTDSLLSLSIYYGFKFRFCNIASGNEKGSVERSVEYIRRKVFSAPGHDRFETLIDANKYLLERCEELNKEFNDSICKQDLLEQEKQKLLPPMPKYECCTKAKAKVDKYSTFSFEMNHYSVPDTLVDKTVDIRVYTDRIRVYYDGIQVASHCRIYQKGQWRIDICHYLRTLKKKPGALPQSTALLQADTQIKDIYEKYYTKNVREFLFVLEIIREKGLPEVVNAIEALKILSPDDISADKIKSLCERRSGINEPKPGKDQISDISMASLSNYDMLLAVLSGKAVS